jgi:hypothetical protein
MTYQDPPNVEQVQDIEAIPVHIASSDATPTRPVSPEYGTTITWSVDTLTNMGQPIRILTERYRRTKAKIYILSLGPTGLPFSGQGTQTAPAANTQIGLIAGANVVSGLYNIQWTVSLAGTPGANETDNFQLRQGATTLATSSNPGAVGEFPQPTYGPVFLTAGIGISVRSGGNVGTAGAVYAIEVTIVPVIPSVGVASVILNSHQEQLMIPIPSGLVIQAPTVIEWENRRPCYAVLSPGSSGPVQVGVLDQSYEET